MISAEFPLFDPGTNNLHLNQGQYHNNTLNNNYTNSISIPFFSSMLSITPHIIALNSSAVQSG